MAKSTQPGIGKGEEKRYTTCTTAGPIFAHVKDGRIIRIEPMHFEKEGYHPAEIKSISTEKDVNLGDIKLLRKE